MACRCRVRVILYNTAVMNALLRAQTGVTYNHPAGHIYMPVAIRKCNYLAYIYVPSAVGGLRSHTAYGSVTSSHVVMLAVPV